MSKRTEIRAAVIPAITTAISGDVNGRIFQSRPTIVLYQAQELPCVCVYTKRDEVAQTIEGVLLDRRLTLSVDILVMGNDELDADLDALADKIEDALLAESMQRPSSGLYKTIELKDVNIGFLEGGSQPVGAARLDFEISYEQLLQN